MQLHTTLREIKKYNPCNAKPDESDTEGWNCLVKYLGPAYGMDWEIDLKTILKANGIVDCLWSLQCVEDQKAAKITAVKFAIFCASRRLDKFEKVYPEDDRPRKSIETAQAWLENPEDKNLEEVAWDAWDARKAAWVAVRDAAQEPSQDAWAAWDAARAAWAAGAVAGAVWGATEAAPDDLLDSAMPAIWSVGDTVCGRETKIQTDYLKKLLS